MYAARDTQRDTVWILGLEPRGARYQGHGRIVSVSYPAVRGQVVRC